MEFITALFFVFTLGSELIILPVNVKKSTILGWFMWIHTEEEKEKYVIIKGRGSVKITILQKKNQ